MDASALPFGTSGHYNSDYFCFGRDLPRVPGRRTKAGGCRARCKLY